MTHGSRGSEDFDHRKGRTEPCRIWMSAPKNHHGYPPTANGNSSQAAAMRSSFDLCLHAARSGAEIDLAVGIEYGPTPMTRLGCRGDDSVRCAASRATVDAERTQQSISGGGIRLGAVARNAADPAVRKIFSSGPLMSFDAASDLLWAPQSPAVQIVRSEPAARSHAASSKRYDFDR